MRNTAADKAASMCDPTEVRNQLNILNFKERISIWDRSWAEDCKVTADLEVKYIVQVCSLYSKCIPLLISYFISPEIQGCEWCPCSTIAILFFSAASNICSYIYT